MDNATQEAAKLTADAVHDIFKSTLFYHEIDSDTKPRPEPKVGLGVMNDFEFSPKRIEEKREAIKGMLLELPREFMKSSRSGGFSFLMACNDKNGRQWIDLHATIEQLIAMGNALGLVEYPFPKEFWPGLYGGMPYFEVIDK